MTLRIEVSEYLLDEALDMPSEERDFVERVKAKEQVDLIIDAAGVQVAHHLAGVAANKGAQARQDGFQYIVDSLDVAIALIALAESVEEVERLKKVAVMLGRQHKKVVKVNVPEIWPALRATFEQVAREREVHHSVSYKDERAFVRRKVRAAIKIINESLANRRTTWI